MNYSNLSRRGHLFWWRRKVTVDGASIPIDLPLRTSNFYQARGIAFQLGSVLEGLRMAYGECGAGIEPATLKKIFQDAMRWQLDRILQSQIGSTESVAAHRQTNLVYGELWTHYASQGAGTPWTDEDRSRLIRTGWSSGEIDLLMKEVGRHSTHLVSLKQLETYAERHGFTLTPSNKAQVQQVIFSARAEACKAGDRALGREQGNLSHWGSCPRAWCSWG